MFSTNDVNDTRNGELFLALKGRCENPSHKLLFLWVLNSTQIIKCFNFYEHIMFARHSVVFYNFDWRE
jgi:hypothetical protein